MGDETWMPGSTDELMSAIEREWRRLSESIARLQAAGKLETADDGGWSPKDNLAHLAEWIKILMGYHMDGRPSHEVIGVKPEVTQKWDFDVVNKLLFERNRGRSIDDVRGELNQVYEQMCARLRSMPFEQLLKPRHADKPEAGLLVQYVLSDTTEHFAEHRATIEKLLQEG